MIQDVLEEKKGLDTMMYTFTTIEELQAFLATLPEGTESDGLASDIATGNFDVLHLALPDGQEIEVHFIIERTNNYGRTDVYHL